MSTQIEQKGTKGTKLADFDKELQAWKEKHGIGGINVSNEHEMQMAAEERAAKGKSWCLGCDSHLPIREMKLITRSIDPYRQCDEGETDYIAKSNRVRMCPKCFEEEYGNGEMADQSVTIPIPGRSNCVKTAENGAPQQQRPTLNGGATRA